MTQAREKFATQVDSKLIAGLREVAKQEGRQIQALVEEALENLLEQRRQGKARPHVMEAYQKSHARFSTLYNKLAPVSRDYLTIADVLAIHADQILIYGGAEGVRDPGQLEAALFRPQSGYYKVF